MLSILLTTTTSSRVPRRSARDTETAIADFMAYAFKQNH